MAKNYFIGKTKNDLSIIQRESVLWFKGRQYDVDYSEVGDTYFIQAKKTGMVRTIFGANLAFKLKIYWSNDKFAQQEFVVEISTGKWIANIAGAVIASMFTGGVTILTGIASAGWAIVVENELINYLENTLKFTKLKKIEDSKINDDWNFEDTSSKEEKLPSPSEEKTQQKYLQDLARLEDAYKNGILTEAEFEVKKADLQAQIQADKLELAIEEKLIKLQEAFTEGVITQQEYEEKLAAIHQLVEKDASQKRLEIEKKDKLVKLNQALENGIISQEEYNIKVAELRY